MQLRLRTSPGDVLISLAQRQHARCYSGATTPVGNGHQVGTGRGPGGGSSESAQVLAVLNSPEPSPCKRALDSLPGPGLWPQHPAVMQ